MRIDPVDRVFEPLGVAAYSFGIGSYSRADPYNTTDVVPASVTSSEVITRWPLPDSSFVIENGKIIAWTHTSLVPPISAGDVRVGHRGRYQVELKPRIPTPFLGRRHLHMIAWSVTLGRG
jgi:hypothetical protein